MRGRERETQETEWSHCQKPRKCVFFPSSAPLDLYLIPLLCSCCSLSAFSRGYFVFKINMNVERMRKMYFLCVILCFFRFAPHFEFSHQYSFVLLEPLLIKQSMTIESKDHGKKVFQTEVVEKCLLKFNH